MSTEHGPNDPTVFHLHDPLVHDHRLADLFDALRSPAGPAELAAESSVLDQMVTAMAPALSPVQKERRPMKSHLVRTIAFATAGVLSVGGVAAAATGTNPLAPILSESDAGPAPSEPLAPTTTVPTTSTLAPTTSGAPTTTAAGAAPVVAVPDDTCPKNHGERVSAVAKDRSLDDGRPHGGRVSEVARDKGTTALVTSTTAAAAAPTGSVTTVAGVSSSACAAHDDDDDDDDHDDDHDDDAAQAAGVTTTKVEDDHDEDDDEVEDREDDHDEVRAPTTTTVSRSASTEKREKSESSGKGELGR